MQNLKYSTFAELYNSFWTDLLTMNSS